MSCATASVVVGKPFEAAVDLSEGRPREHISRFVSLAGRGAVLDVDAYAAALATAEAGPAADQWQQACLTGASNGNVLH
jgi:hypothetical protein